MNMTASMRAGSLVIRPALPGDLDAIERLARLSASVLLRDFLDSAQMDEIDEFIELDRWLIDDETYYVAEIDGTVIGSGGWSRRRALLHRAGAPSDSDQILLPDRDAARIRAMYTHPDYDCRGIGRTLLSVSETSARLAGFRHAELLATLVGEKLYRSCGWQVVDWEQVTTRNGLTIPAAHMSKSFHPV
jgi:GNAT superfamily N-acetyltransferase